MPSLKTLSEIVFEKMPTFTFWTIFQARRDLELRSRSLNSTSLEASCQQLLLYYIWSPQHQQYVRKCKFSLFWLFPKVTVTLTLGEGHKTSYLQKRLMTNYHCAKFGCCSIDSFRENVNVKVYHAGQTDGQTDRQTDGRTREGYYIDSFLFHK